MWYVSLIDLTIFQTTSSTAARVVPPLESSEEWPEDGDQGLIVISVSSCTHLTHGGGTRVHYLSTATRNVSFKNYVTIKYEKIPQYPGIIFDVFKIIYIFMYFLILD